MSRVGRMPIQVPEGVTAKIDGKRVEIKGPKGELKREFHEAMTINLEDGVITVQRPSDEPQMRALHGLTRALVNNMVVGVTNGFSKQLELSGTGYKWEVQGKQIVLNVGFSHPVKIPIPDGINVEIKGIRCEVSGIDKQAVGFVAAQVRKSKPVEPYKGKGIHYVGEYIRRKAGKAGV